MARAVAAWTERAQGLGRAVQSLHKRREAQQRAVACQASSQEQVVEVRLIFLPQELVMAAERCHREGGSQKELGEQGARYLRDRCDVRHLSVEALLPPSESDELETRVRSAIWASGKLHRVASGWWGMSMHRRDSLCKSPSYHRQGFS
jgi:hypothetical protein